MDTIELSGADLGSLVNDSFTNRSSHRDFVQNAFAKYAAKESYLFFAVAFFTNHKLITDLAHNGCPIRMVIRLGYPTSPEALKKVIGLPQVEIRYVTAKSFHPKLYIFGDRLALVGSANLTQSGITTNQEIMVSIPSQDPRFDILASLFSEYWSQSKVLTQETLTTYSNIMSKHGDIDTVISKRDEEIEKKIGKVVIGNIERGLPKQSQENIFIDDFRRSYQEYLSAFNVIKELYLKFGKRKHPDELIPVNIEIDSFISYVRDYYAQTDKWQNTPLRVGEDQKQFITSHINSWHDIYWTHFEETIVPKNYPKIIQAFCDSDTIDRADIDVIINALLVLHSFHDRYRFFPGGLPTLIQTFKSENNIDNIRTTIKYLLFDKGDIVRRMGNVLYDPNYTLSQFGRANIQELVGWVNKENLPIVNGRTTKIMRYFGFPISQL